MASMLIALDGSVEIRGAEGKRFVLVENFMIGPGKTVLTQGEMVISVRIPKIVNSGTIYLKHGPRRAMDIAVIGVAVRLSLDETLKQIGCARIVLGAVAPIPIRVPEAEMILVENGVNLLTLQEVSNLAATRASPITDLRGTRSYRLEMVKVMTSRAVEQAWKQLNKKEVDR
jgi:carbon-monoxide dehydrogenase medium subunit